MYKIIFIDYNFIDKRYPNSPNDGDRFFTYGHGSYCARWFKKYNNEIDIECWKVDNRINKIYRKKIDQIEYIVFPSVRLKKLGHFSISLLKSINRIKKQNIKVLYVVISIRHLLFYSISFLMKNNPYIILSVGESSAFYKFKISNGLKKIFYMFQIPLEYFALKKVDLFLVLDERIKTYFPVKLNNLNLKTYRMGINIEVFNPINKFEAKRKLGLDVNKKYLIYLGRLNKTKRADILIDVFNELKINNNIGLILGGCEKNDEFYNYAKESGAIIYGIIPHNELYLYLSAASVYVLAKLSIEVPFGGIGMLPVQAILCNTPIAGSTVECFPKEDIDKVGIITNDHTTLKNAILYIINNENKYKDIRNYAVKHYSWENISLYLRKEFDEVVNNY